MTLRYILPDMIRLCAADDCRKPFEPVYELQETQQYCSRRCATRMRVRRYRQRLKPKPNGGGPGGKRQPMLFAPSTLRSRKPAKSVAKPKQDVLFPADISSWFEGLTPAQQQEVTRVALMRAREEGAASDKANSEAGQILCKILPAYFRKPSQSVTSYVREAARAA